jgi:translation initiation factor 5B/PHD finger-like domain-containing protein 5A
VFPGEDVMVLYLVEWSDGFEPSISVKSNRGSCWLKTITISPPSHLLHSCANTYPIALGMDGESHEEVEELATKNGIKIFSAEIIYHLLDQYIKYRDDIIKERKALYRPQAIFPCILKILEKHIYNKKGPLIFGVNVSEGELHIGTPITVSETKLIIGTVTSIQLNGKEVNTGKKGTEVCIKVENKDNIQYGRHFDHKNNLCSAITRSSIDIIKEHFRDELTVDDAKLIAKLKSLLAIK